MEIKDIIEQLEGIVYTYNILIDDGINSDILGEDDINAIEEAIKILKFNKQGN